MLSAWLAACSDGSAPDDAGRDAQVTDATLDIATADAADDGAMADAMTVDATTVDAATTDATTADAETDANVLDVGALDASVDCSDLPPRDCVGTAEHCAELVQFSPSSNDDYDDYPLSPETAGNLVNSYGRRDLVMLVTYATAKVACLTRHLAPDFHPLGIGNLSEASGATPGTSTGSPLYPAGTHVDGLDIDVAYYQTGTADNRLRPVCPHTADGNEAYRCTAAPTSLDVLRTALFLGAIAESTRVRLIGVDGYVGPVLEAEIDSLCNSGALEPATCTRLGQRLGYETSDMGRGLYLFHYHRMSIAVTAPPP